MTEAIVEVKGIGKTYDSGVEALRDVNLSFPKGQLSTLLGPSKVESWPSGNEMLTSRRASTPPA